MFGGLVLVLVNVTAVSKGRNQPVHVVKSKAQLFYGKALVGLSVNGFSFHSLVA